MFGLGLVHCRFTRIEKIYTSLPPDIKHETNVSKLRYHRTHLVRGLVNLCTCRYTADMPRAMKMQFFDGERNGQSIIVYIVPLNTCVLHTISTCQTQEAIFTPRRTASDMCVSSYGYARVSHATLVIKSRIPCHVFTLAAWLGKWNCSVRRIVFKVLDFFVQYLGVPKIHLLHSLSCLPIPLNV